MKIYWNKEKNSKNLIGQRVKELRTEKGLNLKQLAKEMNSDEFHYRSLFNLKPGQKIYLQDQSLWLRIW